MDKMFVLIGEKPNSNDVVLISFWSNMPSQEILDKLTSKLKEDYSRFALMQDILFIPGEGTERVYTDYFG